MGSRTSADGPCENVLEIKPPLVLTRENADHLAATLERILYDGT
jgi:4-aminobutyrate aminotransferase-like enzyme